MNGDGKVIALRGEAFVTTEEYEAMTRDLQARHLAGDLTLGDRILAGILHAANYRYGQIMAERSAVPL